MSTRECLATVSTSLWRLLLLSALAHAHAQGSCEPLRIAYETCLATQSPSSPPALPPTVPMSPSLPPPDPQPPSQPPVSLSIEYTAAQGCESPLNIACIGLC